MGRPKSDVIRPRRGTLRDARACRLDARCWETLAKEGKPAETVAAVLGLTLPSTRAALDAARLRIAEREALKLTAR